MSWLSKRMGLRHFALGRSGHVFQRIFSLLLFKLIMVTVILENEIVTLVSILLFSTRIVIIFRGAVKFWVLNLGLRVLNSFCLLTLLRLVLKGVLVKSCTWGILAVKIHVGSCIWLGEIRLVSDLLLWTANFRVFSIVIGCLLLAMLVELLQLLLLLLLPHIWNWLVIDYHLSWSLELEVSGDACWLLLAAHWGISNINPIVLHHTTCVHELSVLIVALSRLVVLNWLVLFPWRPLVNHHLWLMEHLHISRFLVLLNELHWGCERWVNTCMNAASIFHKLLMLIV